MNNKIKKINLNHSFINVIQDELWTITNLIIDPSKPLTTSKTYLMRVLKYRSIYGQYLGVDLKAFKNHY